MYHNSCGSIECNRIIDCNSARTSGSISVPAGANRSFSSASVDSAIVKSFLVLNIVDVKCLDLGPEVEFGERVARKEVASASHENLAPPFS